MSIASLGSHKYGRAEDARHGNTGGGGGALVVRHIPIVIEGEEMESEWLYDILLRVRGDNVKSGND